LSVAGRSTSGVKLLNLDTDDKVAAAVVIPPRRPQIPTLKRYAATVAYFIGITSTRSAN